MYLGTPFDRILSTNRHLIPTLSPHAILQTIGQPLDESAGPAVLCAVEVISCGHLEVLYLLFCEITMPQELLTIAGACGVEPHGTLQDAHANMSMKFRCAWVFLPWFAFECLDAMSKYLRLKFGFYKAGCLPAFNFIMNEARSAFGSGILPFDHETLFPTQALSGLCTVYDAGHVQLNEWEAAFLSILCNLAYDACCTAALAAHLGVPRYLYDDTLAVHTPPDDYLALTLHILMEWYRQPKALHDKITLLQCAFVDLGISTHFHLAMSMYGHFIYHFSPNTTECTPPPSPAGAQGAPEGNGEGVVNNAEIDIVEIIDITDDEPNSNDDPPGHLGVQLRMQRRDLNPVVRLIRLLKK